MKKTRRRRLPLAHQTETSHFFENQTAQSSTSSAFFQPKLEIDPVDSPSEKEADTVAHQVVNNPGNPGTSSIHTKKAQRQGMEEETATKRIQKQDEEEPAAKRIQKVEEEEPAAKRIQKQKEEETTGAKRIQKQEEEEAVATKLIQKQDEEEPAAKRIQKQEEEEPAAKRIQKKDEANKDNSKSVESMIQQTKGSGNPIPEAVRLEMENEFGADFSSVRIHTGADAIEMSKALHAHAFTHGYDIYFNEGRFDPESKIGKELLAHELTHVVQQKGSGA